MPFRLEKVGDKPKNGTKKNKKKIFVNSNE
jgi:hypothetical protein